MPTVTDEGADEEVEAAAAHRAARLLVADATEEAAAAEAETEVARNDIDRAAGGCVVRARDGK